MILEIRRDFIPIGTHSEWETRPFDALVWRHHDDVTEAFKISAPPDYVPGLLRAYIDGRSVDVHVFDDVLRGLGLTRDHIMDAIRP